MSKEDKLWWEIRRIINGYLGRYVSTRWKESWQGGDGSYFYDLNDSTNEIRELCERQEKEVKHELET